MLIVSERGRVSYLLTYWGLILALLLPMYGPWLDPTFAARQPYHNHLYLGEVKADHHRSDTHHDHQHKERETDCISWLPDVINLPDQTVTQQLLLLWQPFLFTTVIPTDDSLTFIWQADGWRVAAIFLTPPEHPPRF